VFDPWGGRTPLFYLFIYLPLGWRTTHMGDGGGSATPKGRTPLIIIIYFILPFGHWG
jgi:hypothetical protein